MKKKKKHSGKKPKNQLNPGQNNQIDGVIGFFHGMANESEELKGYPRNIQEEMAREVHY